ncbi:DUF3168 domain-containing protein [Brevundimonas lenta]|uniref:DUF3168 domain-containing protein n=1 Tax=Brevundimonas lenta TaxID=424796 RepID=A0A7W6NR77_9CAUL|nr:DUF3168 domain-containing protein [Brevundimonas lenta]MBB4083885.1 hypothetical protein [Brevundimonas lenta]
MSHELALQKALIAHLRADDALQALVGDRVWDSAPESTGFPHVLLGRSESRPVRADGCGIEHALTLTVMSRLKGTEEAKAIAAAVRLRLADARLEADGVRAVSLGVRFADVWPAPDGNRTFAVLRLRAVTEDA